MIGFILVIFSAFTHSCWNILLKKSNNKYIFNYQMHLVNLFIFTIITVFFFKNSLMFDLRTIFLGLLAAICFTLYHLCLSTSYNLTDASLVYPITTASPLLVVIWAKFFIGEEISFFGLFGILIILIGVMIMHSTKMKVSLDTKGIIFAILSAVFYSFGAIVDKFGVSNSNFILYVYSLVVFMTMFLTIQAKLKYKNHLEEFDKNKIYVLIGGVIIFLSFLSYRLGLVYMNVSYATSLRQINAVFGVLLGIYFLKEKLYLKRIVGAIIISIGAFIIKLNI
ncbi:DMT family transporter [Deferribacterales bacterium Es71-Z0220]|uniref:DMT family transporter n=1 Tax=Deferrivibrio essentukiensis TaxID=2880922 RepID=UPI001F609964|nr:GRP family sugar transporter [Deferrivibrio essentukiensis]MCB4205382.1 DMT family transporter [Deferrivibrio essentukiensis]